MAHYHPYVPPPLCPVQRHRFCSSISIHDLVCLLARFLLFYSNSRFGLLAVGWGIVPSTWLLQILSASSPSSAALSPKSGRRTRRCRPRPPPPWPVPAAPRSRRRASYT